MRDRLVTALGALAALVLVAGLFFQRGQAPGVTRPVSGEAAENGYLGLERWLAGEGIRTASLQERFKVLGQAGRGFAAGGNILITTMPHHIRARDREIADLLAWVADGNTLLVMAALDDTPDWSESAGSPTLIDDLLRITGLHFESVQDGDGNAVLVGRLLEKTPLEMTGLAGHPLTEGVGNLLGVSDSISALWEPGSTDGEQLLLWLAVENSFEVDSAWQMPVGAGQILLVASGTLFTNRAIGKADNRRFLANLVQRHLHANGAVIFDDMHQGLSKLYDPSAFYRDARVRNTLWFIVGFWLLYLVGTSARLAPVVSQPVNARQGDFIVAVGGLMARKLSPVDSGHLMFETWFRDLRRQSGLPASQQPPWEQLAAMPTLDRTLLASLRDSYTRLRLSESIDLRKLHNTIRKSREAIG